MLVCCCLWLFVFVYSFPSIYKLFIDLRATLRLSFSSIKIFLFLFSFLNNLFFSHLFLFASSPKKNRKNCLTNTLVVLLLMLLFSLFSLPFLPSSSNYLPRFLFYYTQVFIFVFLQSTVHKSGDFCFCLLQLDVK